MAPNPDTLAALTDIALDLARIVHLQIRMEGAADEARVAAGKPPQASAMIVKLLDLYTRIARCIRQIIALHATLATADALTPIQLAAIERKKQDLRAMAAEAIAHATQTAKPDPHSDPAEKSEAEHPEPAVTTERDLRDVQERLTDPVIDQATAIATIAHLIKEVSQTLTPATAASTTPPATPAPPSTPARALASLDTRIAYLQPPPPHLTLNPTLRPAAIPDG